MKADAKSAAVPGVKRLNPMRPLEVALARLRSSLEAMSADTRRRAIEGLSKELRNELVSFMEAQGRRGTLGSRSMMQVPARSVSEGNIWTIRTSSRQYHRARCQIGGVLVRSGSVQRREEALSLLSRLRQTMSSATGDLEQRLVAAAEAFQGSASFVVTLDARRWLGRALESPTFRSLHETLRWRREAEAAEAAGWQSVRALWMDWQRLARPSQFQHRRRSAEEVQRLAQMGDVADRTRRLRKATTASLREARLQRSYGYAKRRAQRLLLRVMERPRHHNKRKAPEASSEHRRKRSAKLEPISWGIAVHHRCH